MAKKKLEEGLDDGSLEAELEAARKVVASALSIKQVAKLIRKHPETVKRFVASGALKAFKFGRDWRIHKADLRAFLAQTASEGSPL